MPKKLWKVDGPLRLRTPGTQTHQYAALGELLEEVTMQGTTDSPEDVRVLRSSEERTIRSYIVSRSELAANAEPVSE